MTGSHIEKILALGASIIVRPIGWCNEPTISLCVEFKGLRNGIRCHVGLEAGLAVALEWAETVKFYDGVQWTVEDCKAMEARSA